MIKIFISDSNKKVLKVFPNGCYLREEVLNWLSSTMLYEYELYWTNDGCNFCFKDKNEAILFKITWA